MGDTLIYSRINKAWARQPTTLIVDMTQRCGVLMLVTERAEVGIHLGHGWARNPRRRLLMQMWGMCVQQEELAAERERIKAEAEGERWARILGPCLRVGVICGGSGAGREASLHSARTLLDQLDTIHHLEAGESRVQLILLRKS